MAVPSEQSHQRYERIFALVEAPFAFVALDAMWANTEAMLARAQGKPVRVASKSVRCRALLRAILDRDERFPSQPATRADGAYATWKVLREQGWEQSYVRAKLSSVTIPPVPASVADELRRGWRRLQQLSPRPVRWLQCRGGLRLWRRARLSGGRGLPRGRASRR